MNGSILELHYYLPNQTHSMNAVLRNKCESELLGLYIEVAHAIGADVEFESLAHTEGGLKEFWNVLGKNGNQINTILIIITIALSRIPPSNFEQDNLETELTKLSIEEKKLKIKKLRKELNEVEEISDVSEEVIDSLNKNPKIVVRRSNYFKHLTTYPKVESIGITSLNNEFIPTQDEERIYRKYFHKFILSTHTIPPIIIEDAVIEIISPVLKEGNYKWKGIYENEPLSFTLTDSEFKSLVLREDITFQHGTCIDCVLQINQKLDEVGEVIVTGYSVPTVIRKFDDRQSFETQKGKNFKHEMNMRRNQNDLFE